MDHTGRLNSAFNLGKFKFMEIIAGLLAPLFLLRRPMTADERWNLRAAAALWAVAVAVGVAFLVINRHHLQLSVVILGDQVWLLWGGVVALLAAGSYLDVADRSRRREKEKRFLREQDGVPQPLDGESPEDETRRLLAEVDRLKREQR